MEKLQKDFELLMENVDGAKEKLVELFRNTMDEDDLMELWNEYCDQVCHYDEKVFINDEYFFEENFSSIYEAVERVTSGSYSTCDSFVKFDIYGDLESFYYVSEEVDLDSLADWLFEDVLNFKLLLNYDGDLVEELLA